MAVQQNKKSKSRKGMRRSHQHTPVPTLVLCACGAATPPHAVCPSCGSYRGRSYQNAEKAEA